MQQGHFLEQIIASFSSRFFMKDFVLLNPKYFRAGHEKELADLLLVLNDTCIVISVKGTNEKPKSETKLKSWLTKRTLEGSKQAKGGFNWLSKVSFKAQDLWGETKEFEPNSLRPLCGIVLLECSQQPFGSIEFNRQQPQSNIPLHFLSLNDFLNVINCLGSIWDVFDYFSKRADIRHIFTGINQEQPVLAYYTLRSKDLSGLVTEDKAELCVSHTLHLFDNLAQYEERERLAGYVNAIVHELHTRNPLIEEYIPAELKGCIEPPDKRIAYLKMAAMLNALPISNKVWIGRELKSHLANLRGSGKAGCFAFKRVRTELVFVFAFFSRLSRTERIRDIQKMLPAALYQYQVTEGLAVAFDADDSKTGFDLIWIRDYRNSSEDDRRLGEYLFPQPTETLIADTFGRARAYRTE